MSIPYLPRVSGTTGTSTNTTYIPADAKPEDKWEKLQKLRASQDIPWR